MKWKIYYGDGSTFSSNDGSPGEAPITNVQVIVQPGKASGRYWQTQSDYYVFWYDRWVGTDVAGVLDFLAYRNLFEWGSEIDAAVIIQRAVNTGLVKLGRTMQSKEDYYALLARANEDRDFPTRTAYMADEWQIGDGT